MIRSKLITLSFALIITMMAAALIMFPQESFVASKNGLDTWWKVVFPSLLPFLIISELLISFGIVRFIGTLLEPLMRPIFRVPGIGGFVWAMGLASGFPAGAKFTARLRTENQLTRIEGERLVCFTNSSNPLFIFVAVAVGFFHNPKLGILLAAAHYGGNLLVGILMRFYGKDNPEEKARHPVSFPSIKEALSQMHRTRLKETRPFGKILGDSVIFSVQTLLMIGGFIILFSVINQLLTELQIIALLSILITSMFHFFSFPEVLSIPFISGLFEMTNGSQLTSVTETPLLQQAIIVSFLLGFSGFSIQAQVASILAETDIRFTPFFFARLLHGVIAALLAFLLWQPLYVGLSNLDQQTMTYPVSYIVGDQAFTIYDALIQLGPIFTLLSLILYTLLLFNNTIKAK